MNVCFNLPLVTVPSKRLECKSYFALLSSRCLQKVTNSLQQNYFMHRCNLHQNNEKVANMGVGMIF